MKNYIYVTILLFVLFGCKKTSTIKKSKKNGIALRFLSEYVHPAKQTFKNTIIGGLSGIDYTNGFFYLVADDSKKPRAYKAKININADTIFNVAFIDVIHFKNTPKPLDLESVIVENNELYLTSEGSINHQKNPIIFKADTLGNFIKTFQLPKKFLANSVEKPRHNGVFEGLSRAYNKNGFWSAIEFPLTLDGEIPAHPTTNSPVRITFFNKNLLPEKEFAYNLEPLSRPKKGFVNLNGLTDILEYKKNHFFIIERAYQSGYKKNENIVRIYEAIITNETTNIQGISSLKNTKIVAMQKRLVFDFSTIKSKLTNQIIDNIEGITLGPKLSNGNQSLLVVSDDNFQKYNKQLNQFILFEIVK